MCTYIILDSCSGLLKKKKISSTDKFVVICYVINRANYFKILAQSYYIVILNIHKYYYHLILLRNFIFPVVFVQ
jgi:hypothetical protein